MSVDIPCFSHHVVFLLLLGASWMALAGVALAGAAARATPQHRSAPRAVESLYHTLHEATLLLAQVEQRLVALEQHATHEREIRTLMLERLNARSRAPRKAAPPE